MSGNSAAPPPRPLVRLLGVGLIVLLWCLLFLVGSAAGYECYRTTWQHVLEGQTLADPCDAFNIKHLHPIYLFFFPLQPEDRVALGDENCSIDAEGFRGVGPEAAGERKLGFLLGGSTAFNGYTNETTITGYLNQFQDEFFFVDAGVPSWNSTQELSRLVHQILKYDPDLVITLDGANDATIVYRYATWGRNYPPGTPEAYQVLDEMIDDLLSGGRGIPLYQRFFPRLTDDLRKFFWKLRAPKLSDEEIERGAAAYAYNLRVMNDVTRAVGGRFVGFFQPIRTLHAGVPDSERRLKRLAAYRLFHEATLEEIRPDLEYHDLATYFDTLYERVPSVGSEEMDGHAPIFADDVHFTDLGTRLLARAMSSRLGLGAEDPE